MRLWRKLTPSKIVWFKCARSRGQTLPESPVPLLCGNAGLIAEELRELVRGTWDVALKGSPFAQMDRIMDSSVYSLLVASGLHVAGQKNRQFGKLHI